MKLVRYGNPGKEKPGLIDAEGKLRDLSALSKTLMQRNSAPPRWPKSAKSKPTNCRSSKASRASAAPSPTLASSSPLV